jgi:hypothetical protein
MIRRDRPDALATCAAAVVALSALAWISGCAPGLGGYQQALSNAEHVQSGAISALEQFDAQYQAEVVAKATSEADGKAKLEVYRAKRNAVIKVVQDAAAVSAVGAALIPLVERGLKKVTDLDAWLSDLLPAVLRVRQAITTFTGGG